MTMTKPTLKQKLMKRFPELDDTTCKMVQARMKKTD